MGDAAGQTPAAIRRLLRRCLAKDPPATAADTGDVRLELEEAQTPPSADAWHRSLSAGPGESTRPILAVAALAVGAAPAACPCGAQHVGGVACGPLRHHEFSRRTTHAE